MVLSGAMEALSPPPMAPPGKEQPTLRGYLSCLSSACSYGLPSRVSSLRVTWVLTPAPPPTPPTPESAAPGDCQPGVYVRDPGEGICGDGEAARGHAGDDPLQREGPAA